MITVEMRWLTILFVCYLLTGCSNLSISDTLKLPQTKETKLFADGLDQYIETHDLTALRRLPQQYPKGEWRARAEGIIAIDEKQQQQQDRLAKNNKQLAHSRQEKETLFEENKILEVTLERLKQVLIDMELRGE